MDVLRPTLIQIGGRVYRKNLVQEPAHPQEEEEDEGFYAGGASGHGPGMPLDTSPCPPCCLCGRVRC